MDTDERLRAALAAAEEANRLKDDFLAVLSHELRTPLNAILGWARMLRAGTLKLDEIPRALETIERNAQAQAQLIEDLLDVSRIVSGKLRLEMHPLDVADVVAEAVETVRPTADARGVTLTSALSHVGPVSGDGQRLQQIVWNLLSNSIKFTPAGGNVHVRIEQVGASVRVIVSDSGQGIEPGFLPHVFDRFRQASARGAARRTGLGLGLAIVRHLVEAHGGSVQAESEGAGKGATFTVELPVMLGRTVQTFSFSGAPVFKTELETTSSLQSVRVLVVDDDPDARVMLQTALGQYGATVTTAGSAEEALAAIAQDCPDILVSDIEMPETTGYDLIRRVRQSEDPTVRRVPAVALTAYARTEDRVRALLAGFQSHVPKPVEPAELVTVIASLAQRTLGSSSPFAHPSLVALRHRNFRLLLIGLLLSFTGSFMQNAALLWNVSLLVPSDQKGLALGAVGLVKIVPIVIFSMVSGVMADAWNRRRLMLVTQFGASFVACALAVLSFKGVTALWPLYALAALGGAIGAFDMPARQSLIPMLVPREHLPNAISLNTIVMQTASVLGPALGGVLIASTGLAWVYTLNALSFVFVVVALLMMRPVPDRPTDVREDDRSDVSWRAALEGLRFVFRAPLIRSTMLLDFFATFFSSATALLPIFAQDILHVGPSGYGWLYAAPAAGAVLTSGAMVLLTDRIERRGVTLLWAVALYGVATVGFGLSRSFWLTFACLAMTGAADAVSMVIRGIVRQMETPDRLRGRTVAVTMVFITGGPQLGELEAGLVANWLGAPFSVISGGIACLLATWGVAAGTPELRRYGAAAVTPMQAVAASEQMNR